MSYYTGDSVPLGFTITDKDGPVTPSAAVVSILKPHGTIIPEVDATITTNTVTYVVPGTITDEEGGYKAYFVMTLSYGERSHKIEFVIQANPGG